MRADVDQSACFALLSTSSLIHSTPSQNLSELVSHILESSSGVEPPNETISANGIQSDVLTPLSPLRMPPVHEISSPFTSPSCVEAVTSALNSFTLSDDVFIGPHCCGREKVTSTESEESSSFVVDRSYTESEEGTNSSDGIRGVWYYLTSSMDSSEASRSTTMPQSSTATSSYSSESWTETTASSLSVIEISSSVEDDETARVPACTRQNHEIITLSDTSGSESDLVCDGSGEHLDLDESNLTGGHGMLCPSSKEGSDAIGSGEDLRYPKQVDFKGNAGKCGDAESMRGVTFILNTTH